MTVKAAAHPTVSQADQRLRAAFAKGETLDLRSRGRLHKFAGGADGGHGGPDGSRPGTRQVIHAWLIRDLLLSDPAPGHIHQVSIREAEIQGELDLRFAKTECALRLEDCTFYAAVRLSEAHLHSVSFRHSTIPEIDARHVTVTGDLVLDQVEVAGPVRLGGAHLEDDLHLAHATIGSPERPANRHDPTADGDDQPLLDLHDIDVKGTIDADQLIVYGRVSTVAATVAGAVRMTNVHIRGTADRASGATQETVAWNGNGMKTEGMLNASGLHAKGMVSLIDAQVRGLVMRQAQVTNAGYALVLDRLSSRGSVFIDEGSHLLGGIHAIGMQVGASLYLRSCQVRAPVTGSLDDKQHALDLRRAKINDDLRCEGGFRATGVCDLTGCHINGRVFLTGAHLRPAKGVAGKVAFAADGAQVGGNLRCEGGFTAQGTMSLVNARVGGSLIVEQAEPPSRGHLSLTGVGLSVARDVSLDVAGAVNLSGAKVNGDLTLRLGRLGSRKDRAAADLSDVKAGVLTLHDRPRSGFLDMTRASITRLLADLAAWPEGGRMVLDGLEYSALATVDGSDVPVGVWLAWLKRGTQWVRSAAGEYLETGFTPQPYQQLAALYQQAGDDRDARAALHAMYCRHNEAKVKFRDQPLIKSWNVVQDVFLGYGYVPWRAVAWLTALALATTAWFAYFGHNHLGIVGSGLLSLGLVLPGSGYDKLQPWGKGGSTLSLLIAGGLVMCGLLLGASVLAALGRAIKR
jgi:hypothetical protein